MRKISHLRGRDDPVALTGSRGSFAPMALMLSATLLLLLGCAPEIEDGPEVINVEQKVIQGERWESELFTPSWYPGNPNNTLQDFSYAGYQSGRIDPPVGTNNYSNLFFVDDYGADPSGSADSTAAIQSAIDAAESSEGVNVVLLGPGTYRVAPPDDKAQALIIDQDNVILRGQGASKTFIYNSKQDMRSSTVIRIKGKGSWHPSTEISSTKVTKDLALGAKKIALQNTDDFEVGDWVVVRATATEAFRKEHSASWVDRGPTSEHDENNAVPLCQEYCRSV